MVSYMTTKSHARRLNVKARTIRRWKAGKNLTAAARLFERFTGHRAAQVTKFPKPVIPDEAVLIGQVSGIIYVTQRDGKTENYIHRFNAKSRPLFAVTHDGRQLLLLGGSYNFTSSGIVDRG